MYDLLTSLSHPDWISELEGDRCMVYYTGLSHPDWISEFRGDRCMVYLQVYHILIGLVGLGEIGVWFTYKFITS